MSTVGCIAGFVFLMIFVTLFLGMICKKSRLRDEQRISRGGDLISNATGFSFKTIRWTYCISHSQTDLNHRT